MLVRSFVTMRLAVTLSIIASATNLISPRSTEGGVEVRRDSEFGKLEKTIPSLMEKGEIPGLAIAVVQNRQLAWSGAFGIADEKTKKTVTKETIFPAASLSKPVFAAAVMRMAERGDFDLDRPLAEFLPYERLEHDLRYKKITARMVLSHQSGLPNWGGTPLEFQYSPNERFRYSGEGFVYLQKVIEKIAGKTIDEIVGAEVFEPCGMMKSSYVWQSSFEGRAVTGRNWLGKAQLTPKTTEGNSAHSLLTTAEDYARFVIATMTGKLFNDETYAAILKEQVEVRGDEPAKSDGKVFWGLGWGLQQGKSSKAFWHWGDNGGFKCYVIAYPESGNGVAYFTNSNDGLAIAESLISEILPDDHAAIWWLDYERFDDPKRGARKSLEAAYIDRGVEAGNSLYDKLRQQSPDLLEESLINNLGYFLLNNDKKSAAIEVFKHNVFAHDQSANARDSLAEAYMANENFDMAIVEFRKAKELDPKNKNADRLIEWMSAEQKIKEIPLILPIDTLREYAGNYGPRHVRFQNGGLSYQRDGGTKYRLIPIRADLFMLDGLKSFRLRFVKDDSGKITRVVGDYRDGRQDESLRTD